MKTLNECPFCHHEHAKLFKDNQSFRFRQGSDDIYRCNDCGLLYPRHRMELNEIQEYLNNMYTNQPGFSFSDPIGISKGETKYWKFLTRWVMSGGNALDIGTFNGSFCHTLGSLGFRAYGLEPQIEAVKYARKHGLNVYPGSFPDNIPAELNQKRFVLISLMECIYYLEDLKHSLQIINQMLTDDGCVLIKCHQGYSKYYNDNSYFSRYGDYVQGIPSLSSLDYCLKKTGFEIVKIMGEYSPDLLPHFLRFPSVPLLWIVVTKLYQLFMLNWTLLGIHRADRLIILAKKRNISQVTAST
jgi:SAM-dependent methyltransferase